MTIPSPCKAVYSYYAPQIRELVDQVAHPYPHDVFLRSITPGLDDFHNPIIQKFVNYFREETAGLGDFEHRYYTSGSNEGIVHVIMQVMRENPDLPIYVIAGEYEGYGEYTKNLGGSITTIASIDQIVTMKPGFIFVSNPWAKGGNIIPNDVIIGWCNAGHKLCVDLAYLGSTQAYQFDLTHPNIEYVLTSLSKTRGLFYYRVGFCFSRKQMNTLRPNKWFKNIFSLMITDKIFTELDRSDYYEYGKKLQIQARDLFIQKYGFEPELSDSFLLLHLHKDKLPIQRQQEMEQFLRDDTYRWCLTPLYQFIEDNEIG